MKKRNAAIAAASAAVVIALVIFVQPVQSFAANVLSALRVQDMRAIHISLADIDQFARQIRPNNIFHSSLHNIARLLVIVFADQFVKQSFGARIIIDQFFAEFRRDADRPAF